MPLQPVCSRTRGAWIPPKVHARVKARTCAIKQHVHWTAEVAMLPDNPLVEPLIEVLQAQGQALVAPSDRSGLHPLLIPLTQQTGDSKQDTAAVTCLLRWPKPAGKKDMPLPVVSMHRQAPTLTLLARTPQEYLHRALAEEECRAGGQGPVAEAAGSRAEGLYAAGAVASSGGGNLNAYLVKKVGMFPDVAEGLAEGHWGRGDTMSALIAAEWYMRRLPGWGRPFQYASQLMQRAGRGEEARDTARMGLRQPWWTFQEGYGGMRDSALLSGGTAEVRAALEEQDNMSNGEVLRGMYKTNPKTEEQLLLEEAEWLMNRAAAGEAGWDDIRTQLAAAYQEAGLSDVARFIMAE